MEFIWWAPFKDRIGSAGTFALAMRGSETVAARKPALSGVERVTLQATKQVLGHEYNYRGYKNYDDGANINAEQRTLFRAA
jgi:hypothetical protein